MPFKNFTTGATPTTANLVNVPNVSVVPKLTFSVTSDNPALVTPTISGNNLTLNYGAGQSGFARITISGTDAGGNVASQTFRVHVTPSATSGVNVTLGTGGSKAAQFTDADGTVTLVKLTGPGTATVHFAGSSLVQSAKGGNSRAEGVLPQRTGPIFRTELTSGPDHR